MEYFVSFENKPNEYLSLGVDNRFGVFWADQGMTLLNTVVNSHPELIETILIKDEKGNEYSVLKFLDRIQKLQIRYQ